MAAGAASSTRPSAAGSDTRGATIIARCRAIVGRETTGGGVGTETLKGASDTLNCAAKCGSGRVTT